MIILSFMFLAKTMATPGRRTNQTKRANLRLGHPFTLEGPCIGTAKGLEDPAKLWRTSGTPAMGAALLAAVAGLKAAPLGTMGSSLRQPHPIHHTHPTPRCWDAWARWRSCPPPAPSTSIAAPPPGPGRAPSPGALFERTYCGPSVGRGQPGPSPPPLPSTRDRRVRVGSGQRSHAAAPAAADAA